LQAGEALAHPLRLAVKKGGPTMASQVRCAGRLIFVALVMTGTLNACKAQPVDRSFYIPNWCEPYGCPKGGGGA
jgi:hypothetical protein